MGEAGQTVGLSDAAGGRAAGRLAARSHLKRFLADERGATAIEYGLIVSLIFLVIVTSVTSFAGKATGMYDHISTTIDAAIH